MPTWAERLPWDIIKASSSEYGLDPNLVAALIQQESGGDTWATRYEPQFDYIYKASEFAHLNRISQTTEITLQKMSFGLLQIMGGTARSQLGFKEQLTAICLPEIGIGLGCKYLKYQLDRYAGDEEKAVAAYNMGTLVFNTSGMPRNYRYVDSVFRFYRELTLLPI